jgi:hypothetical protein
MFATLAISDRSDNYNVEVAAVGTFLADLLTTVERSRVDNAVVDQVNYNITDSYCEVVCEFSNEAEIECLEEPFPANFALQIIPVIILPHNT